jgi:hypothetical protein
LNILRLKSKEGINPVRKLLFNSSDFRYLMWKLKMESLQIVDSFLEKESEVGKSSYLVWNGGRENCCSGLKF